MTEEERNNAANQIMFLLEYIDTSLELLGGIKTTSFDNLTAEKWEAIRIAAGPMTDLLNNYKQTAMLSSKILFNDAANAHMQAVLLADD